MPELSLSKEMTGIVVILSLALVTGLGGVLFGVAYRSLGPLQFNVASILRWALSPLVILALVLGVGARVLTYVALAYFKNVSEVTLLSGLGMVATLVLAWWVLSDQLSKTEIAGGVLIVIGSFLIGR
ncbi:MAG: hypothetical protein ACYDDF_07920 [Thermoplasmatota archaeon]